MFVYFIQCKAEMNPIKIGVSKHPRKRLKDLKTSNPFKLTLLECVRFQNERQAYAIEQKLHEIFDLSRMNGEWFAGSVYQDALRLCKKYADKNYRWEHEIVPDGLDRAHIESMRGIYIDQQLPPSPGKV
jgi:hypothetical protein